MRGVAFNNAGRVNFGTTGGIGRAAAGDPKVAVEKEKGLARNGRSGGRVNFGEAGGIGRGRAAAGGRVFHSFNSP